MTTNFPSSADNFTNPTSSSSMASPSHSAQHADVNDAVEAIETALLDGAPLHIDDANERVGIGTNNPTDTLDVNGTLNVRDHIDFSDTTPDAANRVAIYPHGYDLYVDNAGAGTDNTRWWLNTPDEGEVVIGPRSGASTLGNMRIRSDDISLEGNTYVVNGDVGIGTTSPQVPLHVKRGSGITAANYSGDFAALIYHAANASTKHGLLVANQWIADASTLIEAGNIYATNAAYTKMFYVNGVGRSYNQYGTWGTISDQTLKTDIVDAGNQLDDILGLRFVNYKFIKDVERDPETAPRLFGLVAQEVEQVSPGLVTEDGEGIKTVNTSVLSMKAVKAMQEMHALIESQQTIISELTARIEALENPPQE